MRYLYPAVEQVSLAEGSVIHDTYRLTRLLGQGGMGAVWEAEHMRLPKRVAIKFLLGASTAQPELLSRFRREAEIASRLRHPNIVEVHDFNTLADGTPYLVMERLQGTDLRARLEQGLLGLDEARAITLQVASALALAHREGVIHRDLKPENIFLCEEADGSTRVKVLDFGISKIQGGATFVTRDDRILGTPGYMAPEQAMGRNSAIDGRTDLFALAAIFYEMLTGQSIFLGETLAEIVYKVVNETPEPLSRVTPSVPPGISTAVQRALSKDPSERQPSIQAFAAALVDQASEIAAGDSRASGPLVDVTGGTVAADTGDIPGGIPSAAHPVPTAAAGRAKPLLWAIIGGAGAVLALSVGLWLWPKPGAPPEPVQASTAPPPSASRAAAAPKPTATAADPGPKSAPEAPGAPGATQPPTPPVVAPPKTPTPAPSKPTAEKTARHREPGRATRARSEQALPGSVRAELGQAEAALRSGDFPRAIRLARSSLYEAKSERAYAVMAQAYCGQHDVGMAVAMLRNLSGRAAHRVRAYCQRRGVTLGR